MGRAEDFLGLGGLGLEILRVGSGRAFAPFLGRVRLRLDWYHAQVPRPQKVDLGDHGHCHEVQNSHEVGHVPYQIDQNIERKLSTSISSG